MFEARVQAVRLGCDWYHQQYDYNHPVTRVSMATKAPCACECVYLNAYERPCGTQMQTEHAVLTSSLGFSKQQNQTAEI